MTNCKPLGLRRSSLCSPIILGFLLSLSLSFADEVMMPPPGGTVLFSQEGNTPFHVGSSEFGDQKVVSVEGQPFTHAVELKVQKRPPNPWDFQIASHVSGVIHHGDILWITFWMRATETSSESQEGVSEMSLEQSSAPYDKLELSGVSAGGNWRQFAWSCVADRDYASGETQLCLRGGYAPQAIQIAGCQVVNYGPTVKISDLPRSRVTYPGMEADAPWRQAAEERIRKYREAEVKIVVKDSTGHPLSGAQIRVEQIRQAFGFGSCVVAGWINGSGPDNERYREIIKSHFSKVVMENDLKWGPWDAGAGDGHRTTLAALRWLQDQRIEIRGHNLIWPSWRNTPGSLKAFGKDPQALEERIESHFKDIVGLTKGQLTEWDVVNEPYDNHDVLDLLPANAMISWFQYVHALDPRPELFLNDYAGLVDRGEDTPHKQAFEKTLHLLKEQGAPIGGLGLQSHFGQQLTGPEQLLHELDRWAALGLDIQITEFDLDCDDETLQGQYTRDFMTAVFSHPSVTAILSWGFWEGAHWKPKAAWYRKDWSIKPNGQAWEELVLKKWHTDQTLIADQSGVASTRGFLGDYRITVTDHGQTQTWPMSLAKGGSTVEAVWREP